MQNPQCLLCLSCHTFHILWRWRILHFHKPTVLLFSDEGCQVGRIQFIRCNRIVLEFISWLILFYGVWCWIVTHGSKTQIEAKIKPRSQLWEKNATVRRSWCQKLGPSAPNISSAHRKWFCWCHILHFSTSRHFFVSKICCPLFWQQSHCYVGCSTAPGIYMG